MGTQMTALTQRMNSFNSAINTNSRNFTASVNSIKTQGSALANNTRELAANTTQVTTLGTKIKDTASKFAGFATGLAVTTSGVLQLAAGFRDYNDAQIAVERQTRKVSLANEAVNKAQDKLGKLQHSGKATAKDLAQAQLDVSQALQNQSVQTQLLGERQEDMFDAQSQFVASVIPTTLGAIGTLGAAFRDLGGEKGMGGLTSKFKSLGNVFGGLVGGGGALSQVSGGFNSIGISAEGAGKKAGGLKGNLLGLGATVGVVGLVTAGALALADGMNKVVSSFSSVKQPVSILESSLDKSGKATETLNEVLKETEILVRAGVSPAMVALDAALGTHMTQTLLKNAGYLDENGKQTKKFKDEVAALKGQVISASPGLQDLGKKTADVSKNFNAAATSSNAWVNALIVAEGKARQTGVWTEYTKLLLKAKDALGPAGLQKVLDEVNSRLETHIVTINKATPAVQNLGTTTATTTDLMTKFWAAVKQQEAIAAGFGGTLKQIGSGADDLKAKFLALHNAQKDLFGTNLDNSSFFKWLSNPNPTAITTTVKDFANLAKLADQTNTTAKQLNQTWEKDAGAIAAKNTAKAIEEAKKKLEEFKKTVEEGVKELNIAFKVKDNGAKIVKDILDNIKGKAKKEIKLDLQFKEDKGVAAEKFKEFIAGATTLDDSEADAIAKGIIKTIDEKFGGQKGPFAKLRQQLKDSIADPNTPTLLSNIIKNGDYQPAGKKIGSDINAGIIAAANAGGGLANLWETGGKGGGGIVIPAPVIPAPDKTQFDAGVKTMTTSVANISKTVPAISVNNKQANSLVAQTQKLWTNTQKIVPNLVVKTKESIQLITQVQKLWTNTAKIQPTLVVKNDKALKAVDAIAKRIQDLEKIQPTIKVKFTGSASVHASAGLSAGGKVTISQSGQKEMLTEDKAIFAHKGEFVAIGRPEQGKVWNTPLPGGAGGGGDTTIYINVLDETIMRKIERRSGRNRFTLGV